MSSSTNKEKRNSQRNNSGGAAAEQQQDEHHNNAGGGQSNEDLFSFLSAMHLSGQAGNNVQQQQQTTVVHHVPVVVTSRKRKILDHGGPQGSQGGGGSGKLNGMRPPALRRGSDDEDEAPLQTPQCSQSGYADEEDHHQGESETADVSHSTHQQQQHHHHGHHTTHIMNVSSGSGGNTSSGKNKHYLIGAETSHLISDIVDDNLAADFDGSLSGLGVDINTASYSMSEALNALPNLSISSSQIFKQEVPSPSHHSHQHKLQFKEEPLSNHNSHIEKPLNSISSSSSSKNKSAAANFGALDLSNDEAHLPESDNHSTCLSNNGQQQRQNFTGSVSRSGSRDGIPLNFQTHAATLQQHQKASINLSSSHPNLALAGISSPNNNSSSMNSAATDKTSHKIILPLMTASSLMKGEQRFSLEAAAAIIAGQGQEGSTSNAEASATNRFQYILAASTSIATKLNESSITYLNQGQAYELRLKKLGDLGPYRKRHLKCVMRICFHERRLQYMEAEQIAEWSNKHPGERIIDVDLPLSYGVVDPVRDPNHLNSLTFKWDPTRDTGIFVKVNCISTEFTPKKHGGEKGVPFRLQVETYDNESRLHAAGCILQVFKLKGADRKHKQDRDKINKRPASEQEKFAPSYDCTVLTDLPIEHIYVPASSGADTPNMSSESSPCPVGTNTNGGGNNSGNSTVREVISRSGSNDKEMSCEDEGGIPSPAYNAYLSTNASVESVSGWLKANRYSAHVDNFKNYSGRDLLRLLREEVILLCGHAEGIRLYNDLHMVPAPPHKTVYVGAKDGANEYSALYLEEPTVAEVVKRLAETVGIVPSVFGRVYFMGPHGILVRMTDATVLYTKPEAVFQFSLKTPEDGNSEVCDVMLEEITPVHGVSNETTVDNNQTVSGHGDN